MAGTKPGIRGTSKQQDDLGFGSRLAEIRPKRFLNRDGSYNVKRDGLSHFRYNNHFHTLMTTTWPRLYLLIAAGYIALNVLFALAYLACGPGALQGGGGTNMIGRFADCFFFSVHTLATIGYGTLHPEGLAANLLVTFEALVGLTVFALATGIIFSRFSRPVARLRFSRNALVAPYRGGRAFEFRVINTTNSELVEMQAKVIYTRSEDPKDTKVRNYEQLTLERDIISFFPLQWTIVHHIDENSPLHGLTADDLRKIEVEFIILLTGIEETFSQQVHTRTSYRADEIVFGAKFSDMYELDEDGVLHSDVRRLDQFEPAELPPA